jgi:hypothetical protein
MRSTERESHHIDRREGITTGKHVCIYFLMHHVLVVIIYARWNMKEYEGI